MQHFAETVLIPIQLVLAMVGMGATLSAGDFLGVARARRGVLVGLALQYFLVPAVALGFVHGLDLSPGWAVGLLLIAVVPGGAFSNLLTFLGNANTALSVSVTLVTTVASVVVVPSLLALLAGQFVPGTLSLPTGRIVTEILLYLVLPLLSGMLLLRLWPGRAASVSRLAVRGSIALLVVIVASSLGTGRIQLEAYGLGPPLMLIAFGTTLSVVSPVACRALGLADRDAAALSIEVCVRNIGLALLLVHFFFPGDPAQGHVLYSCLFYAGMSFFLGIPVALRHRRGKSVVLFLPPARA